MGLYYVSNRVMDLFCINSNPDGFFERFTKCVDPQDRYAFIQSISDATSVGRPWQYEGRFKKPSGDEMWFQGMSHPVRHGSENFFNGILLDITERKNNEESLRKSEERFRTIFHVAQVGMFLVNPVTHQILQVNQKALDIIGTSEDDVIGRVCYDFIFPLAQDGDLFTESRQMSGSTKRTLIRADGSHIPIIKTVISTSLGDEPVFLESFIDITEQKQIEEALSWKNSDLKASYDQLIATGNARREAKKLSLLSSVTRYDILNKVSVQLGMLDLAQEIVQESPEMA